MSPVSKIIHGKSLVPDHNTLAYRRGNKVHHSPCENKQIICHEFDLDYFDLSK